MDRLTYKERHQLSGHTSVMEPNAQLNLILLGTAQAGKSASGNTILGRNAFVTNESPFSVTQDVTVVSGTIFGIPVTVYDTPGLYETQINENQMPLQRKSIFQSCESGPCVFLLVIKADRFTAEERRTVEKIERFLGPNRLNKTWILFTRGDELDKGNTTIKEFLVRNEALKTLEKYDQRYHVFNNMKRGPSDQARLLLAKIIQTSFLLNASEGGTLPRRITMVTLDFDVTSLSSRRIVLLGKTGFGKSASGNTILGQKVFKSEVDSNSVTCQCSVKHATISGRSLSVVDTPGLFDTLDEVNTYEQVKKEIARSVYLSSPGPHAFLIVLRANDRFTEHEQQIPQQIEMMFGQEVLKYSIILFTHGDLLKGKSIENLIKGNSRLRHLVQECGDRFHVFNNEDEYNREQVNGLLKKIDTMIEQNGGGYYSNQMFQDAQRFRQEEERRRKREEEWRKREENEIVRFQKIRAEYDTQRLEAERQREEEWRKQQLEIEKVRIQMQNMRTEYEAQRSEEERLKAERQREEEWRKQQLEIEKVRIQMQNMRTEYEAQRSEEERLKAERQREEEWRKQQLEIEKVRIQMQNMRTEYEAQRSEEERLKAERQREEEWRKQQEIERVRKGKGQMLPRAQSDPEFEKFYRQYNRKFSFSAFISGKKHTGIGAVVGGVFGAAFGVIAGPAGAAVGGVAGAAIGGAVGKIFYRVFNE